MTGKTTSHVLFWILLLTVLVSSACGPEPPIRILSGGIRHESNTFCPIPTTEESFNLRRGPAALEGSEWAKTLEAAGVEIIPTLHADSPPFGVVSRATYEKFKQEILDGARQAEPLDGVYLDMHGALHAEGYEDAQADLVKSLRAVVGEDALISASFDLHGNLSTEFVSELNIATGYRTAPHVDAVETRVRAVRLLLEAIQQDRRPLVELIQVPILIPGEKGVTASEPLKSLYPELPAVADKAGLLDASMFVGMAWTDVPRASMSVVVVAEDASHREAARQEAHRLAGRLWERRADLKFDVPVDTLDGALDTAVQAPESTVFITDSGDNTTAGAAGDTTLVLKRLLEKGVEDAVVAGIVDAEAVQACGQAGVGNRVKLTVGGKIDTVFGEPLTIEGIVRYVTPAGEGGSASVAPGLRRPTGRSAVVEVNGILAVLVSVRRAFTAPKHFEDVGIDPLAHKIVIVKLGYLFQALRDIAPRTIMALTPGFGNQVVEKLPYDNIRRPIYPLDPEMSWEP